MRISVETPERQRKKLFFIPYTGTGLRGNWHLPIIPWVRAQYRLRGMWTAPGRESSEQPFSTLAPLFPLLPPSLPGPGANPFSFSSWVHFLLLLPSLATLSWPHTQNVSEHNSDSEKKVRGCGWGWDTHVGPCMSIPAVDPPEPTERLQVNWAAHYESQFLKPIVIANNYIELGACRRNFTDIIRLNHSQQAFEVSTAVPNLLMKKLKLKERGWLTWRWVTGLYRSRAGT